MLDEIDPYPFEMARHLRMTITRMEAEMTNWEWLKWQAYWKWKQAQEGG